MATNLVSQICEVLAPSIISRIASSLGLDQSSTQKAISAGVPGILTALISLVSRPQGATKLSEVAAKQQPGVLSNLASVIGESDQKAFIDKGASALTSLLGTTTVSALTGALGRYAGIGEGGSKSLMGLLAPVVLGILGQQQRDKGLDASGLGRLLTSQKDSVVAALPSGFSQYLGEAGILDDVTASTSRFASRTSSRPTPSVWPWLLGALAVLAIGAFAWHYLSGRHRQVVETGPKVEAPFAQGEAPYAGLLGKLRGIKVGDVDIGELATSAVNDLQSSAAGIKDEATAKTALPGLTKASSEFDQLTGLLGQLSPEARKALAETVTAIRPNLDALLDKALGIPGVGVIIKPTVDAIDAKLDALATT